MPSPASPPRASPTTSCSRSPARPSPTASTRSPRPSSRRRAPRGSVPSAREFRSLTGRGVEAVVDGHRVAVGGPALLRERDLEPPAELADAIAAWTARGASVLYVARDDSIVGAVALEDEIRPESRQAVAQLHALGVRVVMITGDAQQVADHVAAQLGIDEVFAEVLPADKEHAVVELQAPRACRSRWSATV